MANEVVNTTENGVKLQKKRSGRLLVPVGLLRPDLLQLRADAGHGLLPQHAPHH